MKRVVNGRKLTEVLKALSDLYDVDEMVIVLKDGRTGSDEVMTVTAKGTSDILQKEFDEATRLPDLTMTTARGMLRSADDNLSSRYRQSMIVESQKRAQDLQNGDPASIVVVKSDFQMFPAMVTQDTKMGDTMVIPENLAKYRKEIYSEIGIPGADYVLVDKEDRQKIEDEVLAKGIFENFGGHIGEA